MAPAGLSGHTFNPNTQHGTPFLSQIQVIFTAARGNLWGSRGPARERNKGGKPPEEEAASSLHPPAREKSLETAFGSPFLLGGLTADPPEHRCEIRCYSAPRTAVSLLETGVLAQKSGTVHTHPQTWREPGSHGKAAA